jgi:hypothetical protein
MACGLNQFFGENWCFLVFVANVLAENKKAIFRWLLFMYAFWQMGLSALRRMIPVGEGYKKHPYRDVFYFHPALFENFVSYRYG